MFDSIVIRLTEPICPCDPPKPSWDVARDKAGDPYLIVRCPACNTRLEVPNNQFVASFQYNVPTPGATPPHRKKKDAQGKSKFKLNPNRTPKPKPKDEEEPKEEKDTLVDDIVAALGDFE